VTGFEIHRTPRPLKKIKHLARQKSEKGGRIYANPQPDATRKISLRPKPCVLVVLPYGSTTPCRIVLGAEIVTLPLGPVSDTAEITDAASSTTRLLAVMLIVPP
jgi:hypothetical protein